MDEANPSGLFLVTSGSKGDRLLFRYPFDSEGSKENNCKNSKRSPYALLNDQKDDFCIPKEDYFEPADCSLQRFDDKVLSNLFAVRPELCGLKFELKIENVRFIGHPTHLPHVSNREQSTITMFNVVFALRADASHSIVDCYHDLSHRLSVAIKHEECRCSYLTSQVKLMQNAHDDIASLPEDNQESPFNLILSRSELANHLKTSFECLKDSGTVHLKINGWIELSFCLPNKVHRLQDERLLVEVFQLVSHLLYWGKATIIYPLCDSNVYVISPYAPTYIHSLLEAKFAERFPNVPLLVMLSQFSLPVSLSSLDSPMNSSYQQAQRVQMIIWMLQHRLLTQLHTYVYLMPPERSSSSLRNEEFPEDSIQTRKTVGSSEMGSSYQSEESLLSPSHSKASSVSEEDLSLREQDSMRLANLTPSEQNSILRNVSSNSKDDLKNFFRFHPYFDGKHHLEEIMYCENIRRSHLLSLLEKFRNILITCQFEDAAVAALNKRM
ncbi:GATOR complex protein NPRL3-like isoform X3 [Stegodyphus dumicola]|uniref:GATOR complex protein NPRL3-like isoform X3 n=1 Tax=Stegodyphus dumicola TaxID=202533 RepID=UPI0015AAFF16|nr:GATOR complex protein NPRL3-like isoform X3 [Stegodyphus dumicola]